MILHGKRLTPIFILGFFIFISTITIHRTESAANTLQKIRTAEYTDFSRITLEFAQSVYNTASVSTTKNSIIVRLSGVSRGSYKSTEMFNNVAFDKITFHTSSSNRLTMTIPVTSNVNLKKLHWDSWTDLITIDIPLIQPNHSLIPSEATIDWAKKNGMKVVVIDPGHGGFNTNATGSRYCKAPHLKESEVALDIGLRLYERLKKDPRYLPVMTRYGDYLPAQLGATGSKRKSYQDHALYNRVAIAQKVKGDLLISLHFNAPGSRTDPRKPRGFEVHYFGKDQANIVMGRVKRSNNIYKDRLAMMNIHPRNHNQSWASVNHLIPKNKDLALLISNEVNNARLGIPMRPRTQVSSRFAVLNQLNMPAVLAEMAFLSNPQDHEVVRKSSTRNGFAAAFHNAMNDFFFKDVSDLDQLLIALKTAPTPVADPEQDIFMIASIEEDDVEDSVELNELESKMQDEKHDEQPDFTAMLAQQVRENSRVDETEQDNEIKIVNESENVIAASPAVPMFHTVRRGETIDGIAAKYGTTKSVIRSLNPKIGSRYRIYPNQKLQLPAVEGTKASIQVPLSNLPTIAADSLSSSAKEQTYTVRANDTLDGIAILHNIDVRELKAYNNKRSSLIYPGDEIKIPPSAPALITYYVKPGDTIGKIAKHYKVTEYEIKNLNNKKSSLIYPGDKLQVRLPVNNSTTQVAETQPQFIDYKVRYGDSLWKIAQKYNASIPEIQRENGLRTNSLKPNMILRIPLQ